ncbi:MAG: UvrD-helicase domain-containing protein [Armatimonas sp.]
MSNFEIHPFNLLGLFGQDITSVSVGRGRLYIHRRNRLTSSEVDLASARLASSEGWFGFRTMRLTTTADTFTLKNIREDDLALVRRAIEQAEQRKSLLSILQAQAKDISAALGGWETLCCRDSYLTSYELSLWTDTVGPFKSPGQEDDDLVEKLAESDAKALRRLLLVLADPRKLVDQRNERYVEKLLRDHKEFFDTVESKPLTTQQRLAVVHDEDNTLVIAGAGMGKTSCIVAKAGFLLKKGWAKPEEILLLAFTKKAEEEMRERLKKRLGLDLNVKTFHALGLDIIAKATGKKPSICVEAEDSVRKNKTLSNIVQTLSADESFRADLIAFLSRFHKPFKPVWEFNTEEEYIQYRLEVELRSFAGMRVRSFEECEIANWLFLHGVKFEYEYPYEIDTATPEHRQYKPDFYLPDYRIYVEHWGISREGTTAPFMDQARYQEKLAWARQTHQENKTKLVETFSYERMEGTLLTDLERKLTDAGIEFAPITRDEAIGRLNAAGVLDPFCGLVGTFLTHFKSSGRDRSAVQAKVGKRGDPTRDTLFLKIFSKVYAEYEKLLKSRGEIDFEDMIVQASECVRSGQYTSPYSYLLVDEFQDIAIGRADLIRSLRDQIDGAKLFCVGDDWQSIYRFAGGNIKLTTDFDSHFGFTKRTPLGHTFRFHDKISQFSSRFVQKNPGQLPKEITTETKSDIPGVVVCSGNTAAESLNDILSEIDTAGPASVLLLTRYNFNKLDKSRLAALKENFPKLRITELTAHASKGLEADYVIIHSLSRGKHGFPSQIEYDPALQMVLPDSEKFPFAEERRLFYVALTRAKKRVYLIPEAASPSVFICEILSESEYEKTIVDGVEISFNECPRCKSGIVTKRSSTYGDFYGCSNYPICEFTLEPCPRCQGWFRNSSESSIACTGCGLQRHLCPECKTGHLVIRSGQWGKFWGCSNYRGSEVGSCRHTEKV